MPNHVLTKITASAHVIDALLNREKKEPVDFNRIIPMPKIFDEFGNGVMGFICIDKFIEFVKSKKMALINKETLKPLMLEFGVNKEIHERERLFDEFILQVRCYFQVGFKDPIDWSRKYWGTKWNAYDSNIISPCCVEFQTAWNHPFVIIEQLSKNFPNDTINVQYADEDIGYNCGQYTMLNGVMSDCSAEATGSKENIIFACKLHGWSDEGIDEYLAEVFDYSKSN